MDTMSKLKRSEVMSRIASKNTTPEMKVRRYLHARGYRYRLHDFNLPGTPDLVLVKHNLVIQIRGCFWHLHDCKRGHIPKSREEYWLPKLLRTKERDMMNDQKLIDLGWQLLVVWECEIKTEKLLNETGKIIIQHFKCD